VVVVNSLRVAEVFDSIQGEGFWTGVPMSFVRLAGCNAVELGLTCVRWCDTPQSWAPENGRKTSVEEVVAGVRLPRVCITGGEPLCQAVELASLIRELHRAGAKVHLETNGTIDPGPLLGSGDPMTEPDWVVLSPKPPCFAVAGGWGGVVDELKLVADEFLDAEQAERLWVSNPGAIVCVQPEWGGGQAALDKAVALVMSHPLWRLSVQVHRLLGLL
jgi:organic radical activating enzyme